MARRKKSKADPDKKSADDGSVTSADDADEKKKTKKKSGSGNKRASKKKRTSKKATKKERPAPPAPTTADPVEDLDAGLDLDSGTPDAQSPASEAMLVDEPEQEPGPLDDVDAVLDDEMEGLDDLDALIAQTVAGAEPEDMVAEPSVESLDEDSPIEVLHEPAEEEPGSENGTLAVVPVQAVERTETRTPETLGAREEASSTEQDLTDAIDLGPITSPEIRDRLLSQALAHAEMQDARYRVPYSDPRPVGRWKGAVAALLFLVAAVLAAAPPGWVRPDPPAQVSAAGHVRSVRAALLLQAQQVDAYRLRFQRLPDSLDELPSRLPGVRFVKSGNRAYQLIGYERDGNAIIYDSSNPGVEFERLTPTWTPEAVR